MKGNSLFQREIIAKIHWQKLEIFFFRTIGPISTKHSTKHPCIKELETKLIFREDIIAPFNQPAYIHVIINLLYYVYCARNVTWVSDVATGPLVYMSLFLNERKSEQAHIPHAPTLLENAVYNEWQFQALGTGNRTKKGI